MAVAFKMTILKGQDVDIVISDLISDSDTLYQNIKDTCFFNNVFKFNNYHYDYEANKKSIFSRRKDVKALMPNVNYYDCFYVTDSLPSMNVLYELLYEKNKNIKLFYYEEGPIAVLCDQGNHFKSKNEYGGFARHIKEKVFGIRHINGNLTGAYSSVYSEMPKNYFPWLKLPIVNNDNGLSKYVELLNKFWNYQHTDELKNKLIFLEEAFYVDGRGNKDFEIVEDVVKEFGKENLLVKLHPRTRHNRFNDLGLKTYKNTSVPWELIALNGDLDNTILFCIGSGAILYPKLYWGIEQKSIALVNCEEYKFDYLNNDYYKTFQRICQEKSLAYLPCDKNEFLRKVKELINDK